MITGYTRSGGLRYSHFITNIKIYIGGRNDEDRKATSELCIMGVRIGTTAHGIVKMAHLRICAFPPPDLPPAAGFPAAYLDISSFFFPPPWTHLSSAHPMLRISRPPVSRYERLGSFHAGEGLAVGGCRSASYPFSLFPCPWHICARV